MNTLYSLIDNQKELLKKLLPIGFLRKCKAALVRAKANSFKPKAIDKDAFLAKPRGVNIIGDIQIEIGLGQSMRLLANTLSKSKYNFGIVDLPLNIPVRRNDHTWNHKVTENAPYSINLLHINPQELGSAYLNLGTNILRDRYNIGFWLWELEEFPKEYWYSLKFVDEIWTPSEFASNCFRKITDKPVHTIPYHVTAESDPRYDRQYFGLPEDKFLYLIMFDFNSTMLRKNPEGAIAAFKQAFSKDDQDVGLVIKVNNPTDECMNALHNLLKEYKNIYYLSKTLDKLEVNSLIRCADVFVSAHRAEGFGLVIAEAMLLKTACIATNWSSNTEFMNTDTACMVSYEMKQILDSEGAYPADAIWADPDTLEIAVYMKKLKESPVFYQELVNRAYNHVSTVLSEEKIVDLLESRLDSIYGSFDL